MLLKRTTRLLVAALTMAALLGSISPAIADDLFSAVPATANAVARVDVKSLLASPLGQKEAWQGKLMGGYSTRPLAVPAYATEFALAAMLEIPELSPMWQLGLIQCSVPVDLSKVAREHKGVLDKVAGRTAVTTPFDVMHVVLADQRIGTLWPAQRQLAVRLLDRDGVKRGLSPYLAAALKADSEHQIVMAIDLDDAFSGAWIRKSMAMGGMPSLDQAQDIVKTTEALAAVRGVTMKVKVDDAVRIWMSADFSGPVPVPAGAVKAFCLDVLNAAGLDSQSFAELAYESTGNQIVAKGTTSVATVRTLLALLTPDESHATLETGLASAAAPTAESKPAAGSPAVASQEYYRTIAGILDHLSGSTSMASTATQLRSYARKIQQLPVLNVDPDLLAWGSDIVDRLNQCAMILASGQQNAQNAAAAIASPVSEATYSESGYSSTDTAGSRAAFRDAQQQRRQAAQTQRTQATQQAFEIISGTSKERSAIRASMSAKYNIEF